MSKSRKVKKRTVETRRVERAEAKGIKGQRSKLLILDEAQQLPDEPDPWDPTYWGDGEVKEGEGMPEGFIEPMPRLYDQVVNESDYNPLLEKSLFQLSMATTVRAYLDERDAAERQPWPAHWTARSGIEDEPPEGWWEDA